MKTAISAFALVALAVAAISCSSSDSSDAPDSTSTSDATDVGFDKVGSGRGIEPFLARGGRLYDNWYREAGKKAPETSHSFYPTDKAYADKAGATWRCKECHGWDYLGAAGSYASGKHHTGIAGVPRNITAEAVLRILTDETHGMGGRVADDDLRDLALFVSAGKVDMDRVIDRSTRTVHGDDYAGRSYYLTVCAGCHGDDGLLIEDMPPMGKLSNDNPWETLHKIMNGQPGTEMPAMRSFGVQVSADILAFVQSLPKSR